MGMRLVVEEGKGGPRFTEPFASAADIRALHRNVSGELRFVYDAISESKRRLAGRVPLIGFAGAPLTLAAYMIEGNGSKTFETFKSFLFAEPHVTHRLLGMLAEELI